MPCLCAQMQHCRERELGGCMMDSEGTGKGTWWLHDGFGVYWMDVRANWPAVAREELL